MVTRRAAALAAIQPIVGSSMEADNARPLIYYLVEDALLAKPHFNLRHVAEPSLRDRGDITKR